MVICAVLASLFLSALGARNFNTNSGRIIGGTPADIVEYPYQVSLEVNETHKCGGSIISNNWVLTAGHCILGASASEVRIRAGTSYREKEGSLHPAEEVIQHPYYNDSTVDYDAGVIKVSVPFEYSDRVQSIALPTAEPPVGTEVVVTGWGLTNSSSTTKPSHLQMVRVNIADFDKCNAEVGGVTPRMICAGVPGGGSGVCGGDSGGPVAVNDKVVALVSWGRNCADDSLPQVYANVANMKSWITNTTGVN